MSEKASYFKIGVFVIVAVVLAVVAIIVFGSGAFDPEPLRIETYFDTTVTGLEVGANFLVRGVDFGDVESIEFAETVYGLEVGSDEALQYGRYIVVVLAMAPENFSISDPDEQRAIYRRYIAEGLRLRFASQGLTGVAYLDGDFLDPEQYPAFEVPWEPRHPYIPSAPSTLGSIAESIDAVARNLGEVEFGDTFDRVNTLLDDVDTTVQTVNGSLTPERMESIVTNADALIADLRTTAQHVREEFTGERMERIMVSVEEGVADFRDAMASVEGASGTLDQEMQSEEFKAILANVEETTARLPASVDEMNALFRRLNNYVAGSYGDIDATLANLRLISDGIRQLTDLAKRYPSQVLFGNPPAKTRPGGDR